MEGWISSALAELEAEVNRRAGTLSATVQEDNYDWVSEEYHELSDAFRRTLRCSHLVAIGSTVEVEFDNLAQTLGKRIPDAPSLSEFRSDPQFRSDRGLKSARKYLAAVCGFRLPDNADWHRIVRVTRIRHCLVHAEGRIHKMTNPSPAQLACDIALEPEISAEPAGPEGEETSYFQPFSLTADFMPSYLDTLKSFLSLLTPAAKEQGVY